MPIGTKLVIVVQITGALPGVLTGHQGRAGGHAQWAIRDSVIEFAAFLSQAIKVRRVNGGIVQGMHRN